MPVPVLLTRKIRYTNKKAPVQRPFLLAGELAPPAGRVLRVSSTGTGMFFRPGTNLLYVFSTIPMGYNSQQILFLKFDFSESA